MGKRGWHRLGGYPDKNSANAAGYFSKRQIKEALDRGEIDASPKPRVSRVSEDTALAVTKVTDSSSELLGVRTPVDDGTLPRSDSFAESGEVLEPVFDDEVSVRASLHTEKPGSVREDVTERKYWEYMNLYGCVRDCLSGGGYVERYKVRDDDLGKVLFVEDEYDVNGRFLFQKTCDARMDGEPKRRKREAIDLSFLFRQILSESSGARYPIYFLSAVIGILVLSAIPSNKNSVEHIEDPSDVQLADFHRFLDEVGIDYQMLDTRIMLNFGGVIHTLSLGDNAIMTDEIMDIGTIRRGVENRFSIGSCLGVNIHEDMTAEVDNTYCPKGGMM